MRRDLKNRLFRAAAAANETSWADLQSAQHRSSLRARVKICDGISEALRGNGVAPELSAWREEAAAELANIPDTPDCAPPTRRSSVEDIAKRPIVAL